MRVGFFVLGTVGVLAGWSTLAAAQSAPGATPALPPPPPDPPGYPVELVDRPLLLLPGMSAVDIGIDMPQLEVMTFDPMGNTIRMTSDLGDRILPDLGFRHAFGKVESSVRAVVSSDYETFRVGFSFPPGPGPGAVTVAVGITGDIDNTSYNESAGYGFKAILKPSKLAIGMGAGLALAEIDRGDLAPRDVVLSANAGGSVMVQLSRNIALVESPTIYVPLSYTANSSSINQSTALSEMTQISVSSAHTELYGQFQISDLLDSRRLYLGFGIVYRIGG